METNRLRKVNSMQGIHEHGNLTFLQWSNLPLEGEAHNKEWLEPGTPCCVWDSQLESVSGPVFCVLVGCCMADFSSSALQP